MDSLLQIKKTNIYAGLERDVVLFQISDAHMACIDKDSSELDLLCHRDFHAQWDTLKREFAKSAGEFCDVRYDIEPNIIFEALAQHAVDIKADALILSGDIFDRVSESNLRYIKSFLDTYPLPVIYCMGNHDWMNERHEHLNQYERFKGIVNNPEIDSYDLGEIELVTVDNGTKQITDRQLSYLEERLKGDKPIVLVVHAPLNLGKFGKDISQRMSPYFLLGVQGDCENAFKLNKLIAENDRKIIAVLAGHIHAFYEEKITDRLTQYTTSSALIGAGREITIKRGLL